MCVCVCVCVCVYMCVCVGVCGKGVGFTSGVVLVVDSLELKDSSQVFRYSRDSISHISFSQDSIFMATAVSGIHM